MRFARVAAAVAACLCLVAPSITQAASSPIIAVLPAPISAGVDRGVAIDPGTKRIIGLGTSHAGGQWHVAAINGTTGWLAAQVALPAPLQPTVVGLDSKTGHIVVGATEMAVFGKKRQMRTTLELLLLERHSLRVLRRKVLGSTTQPLGLFPQAMGVSSRFRRVVIDTAGGEVVVVNLNSLSVIHRVRAGRGMQGEVVVDDRTGKSFLSTVDGVVTLDTRSGRVVRSVKLSGAQALSLDLTHNRVVAAGLGGGLAIINAANGQELHRTKTGVAYDVALDPRLSRAFVGVDFPVPSVAGVSVISGKLVGRPVALLGEHPVVAVSARNDRVYGAAELSNTLTVVNARSGTALRTIHLARATKVASAMNIVVDDATNRAFVLGIAGKEFVIDTRR